MPANASKKISASSLQNVSSSTDASVEAAEAMSATGKVLGGDLLGPLSKEESGTAKAMKSLSTCVDPNRALGAAVDAARIGGVNSHPPPFGLVSTPAGRLATLKTIEPAGINAIAEDEWVEIDIAVGSGATETVMSEDTINGVIGITDSAACKRGIVYEVADGTQIPNLGERKFLGVMEDGSAKGVTAQVCAVNKTLMSVSKLASQGNRVVFDDDGSYIECKTTGERSWLPLSVGMCYLEMWVSRKSSAEAGF